MMQAMTGFRDGSGVSSWTICKQSAPRSRQTDNLITQFLLASDYGRHYQAASHAVE